jgi:glycosyltransferase involved in cell wall biosynthesis/2-polyprenyl-3-methyl-5-hydroxy-6-metoxy-1,4-benzoquinol methylase
MLRGALPRRRRRERLAQSTPGRPRTVFVNYHDFTSNSAIHILNLANHLVDLGHECVVCVPEDAETVRLQGTASFTVCTFDEAEHRVVGEDGSWPSAIHAWTPRENVRRRTESLCELFNVPYFVHLEDNEDAITADQLGTDASSLLHANATALGRLPSSLSHPARSRAFLAGAAGITMVVESLSEFAPPGVPTRVISPAYERDLFQPREPEPALRQLLGLANEDKVIVYAGNVHSSNDADVRELYRAVALLNRRGHSVRLVRLGRSFVDFLGGERTDLERYVVDVPLQPREEVPRYFALADVFVQPGRPDDFNTYRMPAKLPEFFAMGRPVLLPAANIGLEVADGREAVVLHRSDAEEIADRVESLLEDPSRCHTIGKGGHLFAISRFSWAHSALRLADFYSRTLDVPPPSGRNEGTTVDDRDARYADVELPTIGYATVRDFADSLDHLPKLARIQQDMKDAQRPWTLKAILSMVPRGGQLLEIGAGTPYVARLLAEHGYGVWIVDPYDGRDRGPSNFDELRFEFPHVHFIRGTFPDALSDRLAEGFDCVYSISVLEHFPLEDVEEMCAAIRRFTRPGGATIHTIDHVLAGEGHDKDLTQLHGILNGLGLDRDELDATLARAAHDVDTYYLSAEAHNMWRGATRYDDYPMRRYVSINLCSRVA